MLPPIGVPQVFSTADVPEARRVELWESHNATALIGLAVHSRAPLAATEVNVQLPGVQLARVAGSAHVVERSAGVIRRDPADAIAVYLSLRGDAWFQYRDGRCSVRPGQALVCDADQPFTRGFARGLDELVVKVPRAALLDRAGSGSLASLKVPVVTAFTSTPARDADRLDPYATALAKLASRATAAARPLLPDERTVADLVTVLALGRRAGQAVAHRAAARSFIEDHLADPGLGAPQIAMAARISERQLSRIFAADGTSVPRYILLRRLLRAHWMLASGADSPGPCAPPIAGPSIADVAAQCGFTSAAYFSHAFRAHFGQRASDVRGRIREVSA